MKDFFENPAMLIGVPMLLFGLAGAGAVIMAMLPSPASMGGGGESTLYLPPGGEAHVGPGPAEYIQIGIILGAITAVEVAVYYVDALSSALVPILIVLSAAKFALVVLWFMHLRFDNKLFSTLFTGGLFLAFAVFAVLLVTLKASIT
jgi:cytochrome c oxidase subunit IV